MKKTFTYEYNGQIHEIIIDEEKRAMAITGVYHKTLTEMIHQIYREREKEKLKNLIFKD